MITVTLYHRSQCPECEKVIDELESLQPSLPHQLVKIDVNEDANLYKKYLEHVPIVQVGPYLLHSPISKQDLIVALGAANDRKKTLEGVGDSSYQARVERGVTVSKSDRFAYWLSKNYILLFNFIIFIYVGLPFLAPALMKSGVEGPAKVIYTIYSPLCHQLSFRSFFLFGEQPYYPRELAQIPNVITYEQISNSQNLDLNQARKFIGNEQIGYKVALCQRDVVIYGAMLLFGILFGITGRRIKPLPWYLWLVLGLVPIGVDGVSQLPSLLQGFLPGWTFIRESTPLLRTLTGGMFGLATAWYIYPLIEEAMLESRRLYARKIAISSKTD